MIRRPLQFTSLALVALLLSAYSFGGWAVITVDDLPEYVTAGEPVTISFTVRQHGIKLLDNLHADVVATNAKSEVRAIATALTGSGSGHYTANLVVPQAGAWTITVNSGFGKSNATLDPITAIVAGTRAPAPAAMPARGQRLFVAKGCVTCHVHGSVAESGTVPVGPNLTPKRYQAEYLARFLADPSIARTPGVQATMPTLGLKATEIAALVAFINAERQVSAR